MWRRFLLPGALALGVLCPSSWATELSEPVSVRLVGPPPIARRGVALRATFEVKAHGEFALENLTLGGTGWTGHLLDRRLESFSLVKDAPARFTVEVTPADPDQKFELSWTVDGRRYQRVYDFSPGAAKLRREGRPTVPAPGVVVPRGAPLAMPHAPTPVGIEFTGPIGESEPRLSVTPPAAPVNAQAARWIHVKGQFVYQHQGLAARPWLGADYFTVAVYERDYGGSGTDIEFGRGTTDPNGYFDIVIPWDEVMEFQPDLYVIVLAANGSMNIQPEESGLPYWWVTGVTWNFAGTTLDLGGFKPGSEWDFAVLHVMSDMQRNSRWNDTRLGVALPYITLFYPSSHPVSYHNREDEVIGITEAARWNEGTHGHEYGHHFAHNALPYFPPSYCNGICDTPECGHCNWCPEANTVTTPWFEALPSWISLVQCNDYLADYGWAASSPGSFETTSICSDPGAPALPADVNFVEGYIVAMLNDVYDSVDDEDIHRFTDGKDTLSLGWQPVLSTILGHQVFSLSMFVTMFLVDHPEHRERFWRTAANNRYDFDVAAPSPPADFRSISHTAGVASGDATPSFAWTRATDDASGVVAYSIRIAATAGLPDAVAECGDVTGWTSPPLAPGHYWVTIRSKDRALKWSASYATWGELVIREATPANLAPYVYMNWDFSLVPSSRNDFTLLTVAAPTDPLPGNSAATYWNACIRNSGESSTGINWLLRTWVDGNRSAELACSPTAGGSVKLALNQGPFTVRGGRHTFAFHADDDEEISETVETDNAWAKQWIWTPLTLASSTGVTRGTPPDRTGGWDDLPTTAGAYYNCDGLRVTNGAGGNWRVVWLSVDDPLADYDVRLHEVATSAEDGFGTYRAYSRRPEGCLDAVLYSNVNTPTISQWDVGVLNSSGSNAQYYVKSVTATHLYEGDSILVNFPAGEMMRLREFDLAVADTGWYTIRVTHASEGGPLYVAWFDDDLATVALVSETQLDTATATSPAVMNVHLGEAGQYALALYRDPKDGTAARLATLELDRALPDYGPKQLAGWAAPLVPRPANDGIDLSVPAPDTLYGDAASTYFNLAVGNSGYGDQPNDVYNQVWVDGVTRWAYQLDSPPPLDETTYHSATGRTLTGGRHTLALKVDAFDQLTELAEDDNVHGRQWVFGPAALSTITTRSAPPEMTGGWDDVTSTPYGLWYNCDGLRVGGWYGSGHDYYWGGFAVMPGDTSDVDVRLHERSAGTGEGFRTNLVRSTAGAGQLDYVLVNYNQTAFRAFDMGVLRVDGAQGYSAQVAKSYYRATLPDAVYGPYTLPASNMLHLHEFFLDAGVYDVKLIHESGTVNWGMSAHSAGVYHNLSTTMAGGLAWQAGPGMGETMRIRKDAPNWAVIAVWKVGSADLPLSGSYSLEVRPSAVGVPGGSVARTAFAGAWPNPFGGAATVAFELARECDVSLAVYDLHGARVATLAQGRWGAGRHEVRWDGAAGRPLPAGVYFVRFAADGVVESRRVAKLD